MYLNLHTYAVMYYIRMQRHITYVCGDVLHTYVYLTFSECVIRFFQSKCLQVSSAVPYPEQTECERLKFY
jgi:hypothetical protein